MASEPLRRKSQWRYDHLPRIAIYQDDVQSLFDLFSPRFRAVDLSAGEFKLSDVASLGQIGRKPLHNFSIRGDGLGGGYGRWAAVTIAPMYVQIVVSDDQDVELLGIASAAREILMRRVRRIAHLIILSAPVVVWVPAIVVAVLTRTGALRLEKAQDLSVNLLSLAFAAAVCTVAWRLRYKSHGTLYPFPSSSTQSWWDRNRDAVVTGLLAAVIGGLVLLALELALGVLRLPGPTPGP
jgi:hypothetical protein